MEKNLNDLYEFGPFRLDRVERLLLRGGETVQLTPKAFDLLSVLIDQPGHLFEKETLMKLVWPDSFVEENNLADNISRLRKALGEGGDGQKFIETVPKRGYRFVAEVTTPGRPRVQPDLQHHAPVAPTGLSRRNSKGTSTSESGRMPKSGEELNTILAPWLWTRTRPLPMRGWRQAGVSFPTSTLRREKRCLRRKLQQ